MSLKKSFAANMLSARISQIGKSLLSQDGPVLCTNPQHDLLQNRQFFLFLDLFCFLNGSEIQDFNGTLRPICNFSCGAYDHPPLPDLSSSCCVAKINVMAFRRRRKPGASLIWGCLKMATSPKSPFQWRISSSKPPDLCFFSRIFRKFSVGQTVLWSI